jgi:hypothetical protein
MDPKWYTSSTYVPGDPPFLPGSDYDEEGTPPPLLKRMGSPPPLLKRKGSPPLDLSDSDEEPPRPPPRPRKKTKVILDLTAESDDDLPVRNLPPFMTKPKAVKPNPKAVNLEPKAVKPGPKAKPKAKPKNTIKKQVILDDLEVLRDYIHQASAVLKEHPAFQPPSPLYYMETAGELLLSASLKCTQIKAELKDLE